MMYQCRLGSPIPWPSLTRTRSTYVFGTPSAPSSIFPMCRLRRRVGFCLRMDSTGSGTACCSTTESNSATWIIDTSNRQADPPGVSRAPQLDVADPRRERPASSFPCSVGACWCVVPFRRTVGNSDGRLGHCRRRRMDEVGSNGSSRRTFRSCPPMRRTPRSHSCHSWTTLRCRSSWFLFRSEYDVQQHDLRERCLRDVEAG